MTDAMEPALEKLDLGDSDDEVEVADADTPDTADPEKKKKKKKKSKKKKSKVAQTEPPTVPVSRFFRESAYPVGEIQEYNDGGVRISSEEKRHLEQLAAQEDPMHANNYNSIRRAAEAHRQTRAYAQRVIRPGMTMTEIADMIENGTRALVEVEGTARGIGFPTGLSLNHCAAHYTPNAGDSVVLSASDVLKVDIGVQVSGRIVDSAFTLNPDGKYDTLLAAVRASTNAGIAAAGIDARMGEIGAVIQETMESYEVDVDGKTLPVKSIRNLTGHSIKPYQIHGSKSVPIVKLAEDDDNYNTRMEEGEHFAIETFGSTGHGWVRTEGVVSHYAKNMHAPNVPLQLQSSKKLLQTINKNFGTLPFCRRYLDRLGEKSYLLALRDLVEKDLVNDYPPLVDAVGSMTAQFEHTIILRPTCKEVVSRGDDY